MMRTASNLVLVIFLLGLCICIYPKSDSSFICSIDYVIYLSGTFILLVNVLRREPAQQVDASYLTNLICLISVIYFFAFELSASTDRLAGIISHIVLLLLHVTGDVTLIYLGRSFALLPARRAVRTGWLYRYVRHPVYATYILADLIYISLEPSLRNFAVAIIGAGLFLFRADREERLLMADPIYLDYCSRVRYRFIPGLY